MIGVAQCCCSGKLIPAPQSVFLLRKAREADHNETTLDLKMDLVNITESPDSGKHVRKLLNIRAGEPDPLLFQVPSDFTVREMPQP